MNVGTRGTRIQIVPGCNGSGPSGTSTYFLNRLSILNTKSISLNPAAGMPLVTTYSNSCVVVGKVNGCLS